MQGLLIYLLYTYYSGEGPGGGMHSTECRQTRTRERCCNGDHSQQVSPKKIHL